jgi:hypothetical protein
VQDLYVQKLGTTVPKINNLAMHLILSFQFFIVLL